MSVTRRAAWKKAAVNVVADVAVGAVTVDVNVVLLALVLVLVLVFIFTFVLSLLHVPRSLSFLFAFVGERAPLFVFLFAFVVKFAPLCVICVCLCPSVCPLFCFHFLLVPLCLSFLLLFLSMSALFHRHCREYLLQFGSPYLLLVCKFTGHHNGPIG